MLTVSGLRKIYQTGRHQTVACDSVDLNVPSGAFATVLGPSGSGKTTLLRCIAGFEAPDAGIITLADRTLNSPNTAPVAPHDRGIGIVPQEGALFPHLTIARNIAFGISGQPRKQRRERVAELLELIGLEHVGDRHPHQLSGGQQQRVALARALAPEPRLILLDEPFSALDAQLRIELREEVRDLLRQVNTTALLVTHDQAEAMTLADRIVIMDRGVIQAEAMAMADHLVVMRSGRVISAGEPRRVYDAPADAELGRFLGEAVVLPGTLESVAGKLVVNCPLGKLAATAAGTHGCSCLGGCEVLLRPEQLTLHATGQTGLPEITGVIISQSFYGHDSLVRVRLESGESVSVRAHGSQRFTVNDRVSVRVDAPVTTYPKDHVTN